MDQPNVERGAHVQALIGLGKANRVCGIARSVWSSIQEAFPAGDACEPIRILDIAAGGGDILRRMAQLARKVGVAIEAHGCDMSDTSVAFAQDAAGRAGLKELRFFRLNVLGEALPTGYDVVMSTLFLHHLANSQAQELLARMAQATERLVLVDDLRRTAMGYAYAWLGGRLLTRSPIVHVDGPLSVRSAFSIDEVTQLAAAVGLDGAIIESHWPQRFQLTWTKL